MRCRKHLNLNNSSLIVSLFTSVLATTVLVLVFYIIQLPCSSCTTLAERDDLDGHTIRRSRVHLNGNAGNRIPGNSQLWHTKKKERKTLKPARIPDLYQMDELDSDSDYDDDGDVAAAGSDHGRPERNGDIRALIPPSFSRLSHPVKNKRSLQEDSSNGDFVTQLPTTPSKIWLNSTTFSQCQDSVCSEYLSPLTQVRSLYCAELVRSKNATIQEGKCHFINGTGRAPVALVSFPGSGNTWARGLLETTTGICTGAVYCDMSLRAQGFAGEFVRDTSTLVVKTHENEPKWLGAKHYHLKANQGVFGSAIFLVRNPFRALVAEWNRKVANNFRSRTQNFDSHVKSAGEEWFGNNTRWQKYVFEHTQRWQNMIKSWVVYNIRHPVLVVKYEELKSSTLPEVKKMLDFLQVVYNEELLEGKLNEQAFNHFRRSHKNDKFDYYTSEQVEFIKATVEDTISLLEEQGLDQQIDMRSYRGME